MVTRFCFDCSCLTKIPWYLCRSNKHDIRILEGNISLSATRIYAACVLNKASGLK